MAEKGKPKDVDIDKIKAMRLSLLAKAKSNATDVQKNKKLLASFDAAVKATPED